MPMHTGEKYRCNHAGCGCEISVVKGVQGKGGEMKPRCCCGTEMEKVSAAGHAPGL